MDLRDVEKIAVDTYRKMSVVEQGRFCPECKKYTTMIGVEAFTDESAARTYMRCLKCLTLFEKTLIMVETRKELVVSFPLSKPHRISGGVKKDPKGKISKPPKVAFIGKVPKRTKASK